MPPAMADASAAADILDDPALKSAIADFPSASRLSARNSGLFPGWTRLDVQEVAFRAIKDMALLGVAGSRAWIEVEYQWRGDLAMNSYETGGRSRARVTVERAGGSYRVVEVEFPGL